ncbi:MAG: glycosyltransferase 4 family protein [archaeon]
MIELILLSLIILFFSFLTTFLVTPFITKRIYRRGLVGRDMNKYDKRKVAEMGGIGVIFGFSFGIIASIFLQTYFNLFELNLTVLFAAFSTIILIGFLGIVDDLIGWKKGIRQWQHALFPIFASLPLMAVNVEYFEFNLPLIGVIPPEIILPFIGAVSFSLIYSILLVPIGITGASNGFNMLAGFNGLEAGLGILTLGTILLITFFTGNIEAMILMAAMVGALLAFLKFNWFPARIFPGDALTLMTGAALAAAVIIGNMEKIGVMLMALFFIELIFKARHRFQSECYGIPQKDGTLKANPRGGSLTQWVMRRGSFTEAGITSIILAMQFIVCLIVFLLFWFKAVI